MAYQFPPDIEQLVREQMAGGRYESEDDLLRDAIEALREMERRHDELRNEVRRRVARAGTGLATPLDRDAFRKQVRQRQDTASAE